MDQRNGKNFSYDHQLTALLCLVGAAIWWWSAIEPHDFSTWLIEQMATAVGVATVLWFARTVHFDRISRITLFLLFCLHTIGTHYTYSLTPYAEFSTALIGSSPNDWFGWQRNHYDRLVHFAYGLLTTRPFIQVLQQRLQLTHRGSMFMCGHIVISTSALYELAEWAAAVSVGGNVGTAYLGTQGDIWDAQADIALAGLGWVVALGLCALVTLDSPKQLHSVVDREHS